MMLRFIALLKISLIALFGLYYHQKAVVRSSLTRTAGTGFTAHIVSAAGRHSIHPALVAAIIHAESNFNPRARSYAGAKGLMQINRVTAAHLKLKDVYHPGANIEAGVRYLKELSVIFNGNLKLVIAAYNAGPTAVKRFKGVPPYRQTRTYVAKVLRLFDYYKYHPDFRFYL